MPELEQPAATAVPAAPVPESSDAALPSTPERSGTVNNSPISPAGTQLVIGLPESLISSVDLAKVTRELAALDDSLRQADIRAPGVPVKLGRSSQILEDSAVINRISLLDAAQRGELLAKLQLYTSRAPVIHISFAVEPSPKFTNQLILWLRKTIDPLILLEIGLQPTLAVGCKVRTNNKVFDMSLRHRFTEQRHILVAKIIEQTNAKAVIPAAPQTEVAST